MGGKSHAIFHIEITCFIFLWLNLCIYTCFVYLQPFCVTLDFKLFIDSIHILFLLYLLLGFRDFYIKNLQDLIEISRALIKDIFLAPPPASFQLPPCHPNTVHREPQPLTPFSTAPMP